MLDVDVNALSLWLEREALPKVSDADPTALAEYILALLDTIDLAHLNSATKADCVSKLSDFFDTHTAAFVEDLFAYLALHRGGGDGRRAEASSDGGDERRDRPSTRSRSPARRKRSASDSRSRSRDRSRDRAQRRRGGAAIDSSQREKGREDSAGSRRGNGLLLRDDRYGIQQVVSQRDRDLRGGGWEHRDTRDGPPQSLMAGGDRRGGQSLPFPPDDRSGASSRPVRSVRLPASNPFNGSASQLAASPPSSALAGNGVRVGHHVVVVKRKREDSTAGMGAPTASAPFPSSSSSTSVLLTNAPRFVLSMRMLSDHFSHFGELRGIEIREGEGTATIRFATPGQAQGAVHGRPVHPEAHVTLEAADGALPVAGPLNGQQPLPYDEEEEEDAAVDVGSGEGHTDGAADNGTGASTAALDPSSGATTIAVGRRTLTLKPKPPPPPPDVIDVEAVAALDEAHTPAPLPGSALYAAQLIRQQKAAQPQPPPQPGLEAAPNAAQAPQAATNGAGGTAAGPARELQLAQTKLQLLQKQIDTAVALVARLEERAKAQGLDSAGLEELQRKKGEVEASLEETRRRWRQERGKIVRLTLGTAATAAGAL